MEPKLPAPASPTGPKFPAVVMAAGTIWIALGGAILSLALVLVISSVVLKHGPNGMVGEMIKYFLAPCLTLVGTALLAAGIRTVRGRAHGMLSKGIASIAFGVLFFWATTEHPEDLVISGGVALAFIVPGVLALLGRADYRVWRLSRPARPSPSALPTAGWILGPR
jgi:hypothetical protein